MSDKFDQILAKHDPEIRATAKQLRELVRKAAPQTEERVQLGWRNVAWYLNGMFCYVQPQREWVNIGFNRGAELDDALLEGSGKGMRHVKVHSRQDLPAAALSRLVKRAYELQVKSPRVKIG